MFRRRPVVEPDNSLSFPRESVVSSPKVSVPVVPSSVSYNEDSDTISNTPIPNIGVNNSIQNATRISEAYAGTMMSREEIEATKEWFRGMTETMYGLVREQRLLVEAQTECLQMLKDSATAFTVAVGKFCDATPQKVDSSVRPETTKCYVCGQLGHMSRQCVYAESGLRRCYECHQMATHTAEQCRKRKAADADLPIERENLGRGQGDRDSFGDRNLA